MPGLKTVKELRAEVERLTRLNARYRRENLKLRRDMWRGEVIELFPPQPWYRRCWNWITGR